MLGATGSLCLSSSVTRFLKKDGVRDMGRGRGGYTEKQPSYKDSGGHKVTDKNAVFVGERYMDQGYEVVFRRKHDPDPSYDLTIKTSDDEHFVKNIEVKGVTSPHTSKIADNIKKADKQIAAGDTIAIYLPNHRNSETGRRFADEGIAEARRKGLIKGPVEVWFSDKTKITY